MQEISVGALKIALGATVNDVHSGLNKTWVSEVVQITSLPEIQAAVKRASTQGRPVTIAGGRHAMGGQQFGTAAVLLDMTRYKSVLSFDRRNGTITVESGIQWPDLIDYLVSAQEGQPDQWGIIQKQTGADNLTIGGALSANVHGRGLTMKPFIDDVESFLLIDAGGNVHRCSRSENYDLFCLAIGGYGLFGVIGPVTLRLTHRRKLVRMVELTNVTDLIQSFDRNIDYGCLYGDFQFSIDETSDDFLSRGVLSTYRPVDDRTPVPQLMRRLSMNDWNRLVYLAHTDRREAFRQYRDHYLATSGQVYFSDTHQLSTYLDGYHERMTAGSATRCSSSEIITEIYVPRSRLADFMQAAGQCLRQRKVTVIYGTIRLIERDSESFLAWARDNYACVIFNLHTDHTREGIACSAAAFRDLIDLAIVRGGSFYLTYHRFADKEQVLACYPQFKQFLKLKKAHDPGELFLSDWYKHYR